MIQVDIRERTTWLGTRYYVTPRARRVVLDGLMMDFDSLERAMEYQDHIARYLRLRRVRVERSGWYWAVYYTGRGGQARKMSFYDFPDAIAAAHRIALLTHPESLKEAGWLGGQ